MPRFSINPEGREPIPCESADQAVQYFANALHHGLSGTWTVHTHLPRFPVHPTKRRGPDELYVSLCGKYALRKRVAEEPWAWVVLGCIDCEWREICRGRSRRECEDGIQTMLESCTRQR
jgi:hypothetical protein